ncbi:oxysterol-binding protein-related protein 4B-like [Humulus lupulus]|uniref:oxysterol-binding protein-related protein 4B-like n=1 Tax=Humulus lupulus TaxID=3486 RepID=UPI002B40F0C2|nr:oxysterol-binding protein-related protein 4B-like [Humulus lupulus]
MNIKEVTKVVLTKPLSIESINSYDENKASKILQGALSLLKNVRPGSDLTRLELPPMFNIPKSQLQCYGESVYCVSDDLLGKCNRGESPIERFKAVLAWNISTLRPSIFGVAPYNPILGETHHVSRGTLIVLFEQISYHPPVTALHAMDEKENVELLWCQHLVSKLSGTLVEVKMQGKRELKLMNHGETYVMNSPSLLFKFFPPGVEWEGSDQVKCHETGLEAELTFGGRSFLGLRGTSRSIKGKIFDSSSKKLLFEINGQWDKSVMLKDLKNGEVKVLYSAKEAILGLTTPIVIDPKGVWQSESALVWSEVSQGIMSKDWAKAIEAKKAIEENQRVLLKERKSKPETWVPKHFIVSYSKENGWDCSPLEKTVPPAPIIIPFHS